MSYFGKIQLFDFSGHPISKLSGESDDRGQLFGLALSRGQLEDSGLREAPKVGLEMNLLR